MQVSNFNLRVYGLLIHDGQLLITREHRSGMDMTKLPGGGLEKGEGLTDGLIREFKEELDIDIQAGDLFYVNEFLQISTFNPKDQLLSFYYMVEAESQAIEAIQALVNRPFVKREEQTFEWMLLKNLNSKDFTFPIDRAVIEKLKALNV